LIFPTAYIEMTIITKKHDNWKKKHGYMTQTNMKGGYMCIPLQ
jgi:hypothetical protein